MVPFKLEKMKGADPPFPPPPTGKDEGLGFIFATWPVGPTAPIPPGGMAILPVGGLTAVTFVTSLPAVTAKRVAVLVPWFEVQKGLVAVWDIPQGLTSSGSVMLASPGISETR